ncbi:SPOR domain-containing protein [Wohlfahrtiimonas populi]|uniref:SPOR domain-containing protein n=1 Tax=Wohlfahrtiimonas populi TaxID=1940240 RepID=UPI00098D294A|nr:SPOR domain-containing protein [Wohlfahrtiimonas populi]
MAKKYFQAKKQNNPFAKKHPNSKKNRITTIAVVILFLGLGVSGVISYFSNKGKDEPVKKVDKPVVNAKDTHPKRVVKPLSDEDFKGAKEYNFYTQLEERSLILGEEERFGGIPLDNIHEPPKISLESMSQSVALTKQAQHNDFAIAPLVLESSHQRPSEPAKPVVKPEVKTTGNISLQVGSFTARKDAEKHQAFLAKYGFTAKILQGKKQSQQDIYRVRIGGFTQQEVEAVKKRLGALGVGYFEVK